MNQVDAKIYTSLIRTCRDHADYFLLGVFNMFDQSILNGTGEQMKDVSFRKNLISLISHITELSNQKKEIPLDEAKGRIKMSLANTRIIAKTVDEVFEGKSEDASVKFFKMSQLINPVMRLRWTLHDAMSLIERSE